MATWIHLVDPISNEHIGAWECTAQGLTLDGSLVGKVRRTLGIWAGGHYFSSSGRLHSVSSNAAFSKSSSSISWWKSIPKPRNSLTCLISCDDSEHHECHLCTCPCHREFFHSTHFDNSRNVHNTSMGELGHNCWMITWKTLRYCRKNGFHLERTNKYLLVHSAWVMMARRLSCKWGNKPIPFLCTIIEKSVEKTPTHWRLQDCPQDFHTFALVTVRSCLGLVLWSSWVVCPNPKFKIGI